MHMAVDEPGRDQPLADMGHARLRVVRQNRLGRPHIDDQPVPHRQRAVLVIIERRLGADLERVAGEAQQPPAQYRGLAHSISLLYQALSRFF